MYDLYITHKNCDVKYILHKDVKTLLDEEEISLENKLKQKNKKQQNEAKEIRNEIYKRNAANKSEK